MKVKINGHGTITGTPEAILQVMHDARYIPAPEGDGYIETVKKEAEDLLGVTMHIEGATYRDRAVSFLHEMERNQMITIEEEN